MSWLYPFLTTSLAIYHSRVKCRLAVKKCAHTPHKAPHTLMFTTIFGSKKTRGTLWLLMLGEGVLVPSPKFWVPKSEWPNWKSKLAWFSISIGSKRTCDSYYKGVSSQSAASQLPLWGENQTWLMESNLGPPHTRDWEPVTVPLQAPSLVEKAELVQVRFPLRLRDQRSI